MPVRVTHTVAVLELSQAAYDEIAKKLAEAGYTHAFDRQSDGRVLVDMTGIGLLPEQEEVFNRRHLEKLMAHARDRSVPEPWNVIAGPAASGVGNTEELKRALGINNAIDEATEAKQLTVKLDGQVIDKIPVDELQHNDVLELTIDAEVSQRP